MKYYDFEYRVRYADTDKMGISYYGYYFSWFEAARTEYFRALNLPYTECEKKGYFLPVIETGAKYYSPSTYDDLVIVRTSVSKTGKTSLHFQYRVFQKESQKLIVTGFSVHAFVDKSMRPVRMPEEIRNLVEEHALLDSEK